MFLRETVQHCATCDEVTPHSQRGVAIPRVLGFLALVVAGWCFLNSEALGPLGVIPLAGALVLLMRDRSKPWGVQCVRCRMKRVEEKRAEKRRTGPTLGRNTEIDIL